MDKLDLQILEKERECADLTRESDQLKRRLEIAQIELRTLQLAASLRPGAEGFINGGKEPETQDGTTMTPKKGKPPGSLSEAGRKLLFAMIRRGNPLMSTGEIAQLSADTEAPVDARRAGDRMRKYVSKGFAERIGDRYRISETGIALLQGIRS